MVADKTFKEIIKQSRSFISSPKMVFINLCFYEFLII